MKTCIDCKEPKQLEEFHKKTNSKDGVQARCKECNKARAKKWQSDNADRHENYWKTRDSDREFLERKYLTRKSRRYNISEEKLVEMFQSSSGKCNLCQQESERVLAIDHCHKTMVVRGLLCTKCNTALGLFNDDIELLEKAIKYLKQFESRGAHDQI